MALKTILIAPDPRLKKKSKPVDTVDAETRQLMDDMLETMYAAPGIGLAAPQVGVLKRVIVLDIDREEVKTGPLFMAHISALKRNMILRKLLKARKEAERDEADGKHAAKDKEPAAL